tara:strand:- start:357 stop:1247 length:891 start_codon:yes stop_codon:yes gene_type:complete
LIKKIKIITDSENQRLDKFLKKSFSSLTQSFIEKNLRKKNILVNNKTSKAKYLINKDDLIIIKNFSKEIYADNKIKKTNKKIDSYLIKNFEKSILHENSNFLVIDKWSGISTQGGTNITISIDTIIKNISSNYNLVHRLDRETSGLLLIAKNLKYTKIFGKLFRLQKIKKIYLALCEGQPKLKESYVDLAIKDKDMINSVQTKTYYKVISYNNKTSLIQFEPKTGKKHQLRIVAKNLGCPIVGDNKYNLNQSNKQENLKLNAHKLEFNIENIVFNYKSKLPKDFTDYVKNKQISYF